MSTAVPKKGATSSLVRRVHGAGKDFPDTAEVDGTVVSADGPGLVDDGVDVEDGDWGEEDGDEDVGPDPPHAVKATTATAATGYQRLDIALPPGGHDIRHPRIAGRERYQGRIAPVAWTRGYSHLAARTP